MLRYNHVISHLYMHFKLKELEHKSTCIFLYCVERFELNFTPFFRRGQINWIFQNTSLTFLMNLKHYSTLSKGKYLLFRKRIKFFNVAGYEPALLGNRPSALTAKPHVLISATSKLLYTCYNLFMLSAYL